MIHFFLWAAMVAAAGATQAIAAEVTYSEVSRKEVRLGDHTVTLIRVRPPVLPKAVPAPAAPSRPLTAEEKAREERLAQKGYATLSLSVTVYLGGKTPVTELRWRDEGGGTEYLAYSNIDFRHLTQLSTLETETTVYSWFPFVEEWHLEDWPSDQKFPIPQGLNFSPTDAEYYVDEQAKRLKDQETTLAGLDYLHAYYQINHAKLKADYEKREVENAGRERRLRENPPKPPDVNVRWWPLKS